MDKQKIVENIQRICKERGTNPTTAGERSGAGKEMVTNMKRKGTMPSIERFQLLAQYLDVTVSELLGEEKKPIPVTEDGPEPDEEPLMNLVEQLTPDQQRFLVAWLKTALSQEP
ncbi:helix-turn-helix transcriptional regulator [Oscillospiraceae bacterium 38-13]